MYPSQWRFFGPHSQSLPLNFNIHPIQVISVYVRHEVIVIVNRNRLQSITFFWVIVIVIDWIDQKWNVIIIDYIANFIVIDDYFRD